MLFLIFFFSFPSHLNRIETRFLLEEEKNEKVISFFEFPKFELEKRKKNHFSSSLSPFFFSLSFIEFYNNNKI